MTSLKGKTFEQIYGLKKAKKLKEKLRNNRLGKPAWNKGLKNPYSKKTVDSIRNTLKQKYASGELNHVKEAISKAQTKRKQSKSERFKKGIKLRGKTYEEVFGDKQAKEIKRKIRNGVKKSYNNPNLLELRRRQMTKINSKMRLEQKLERAKKGGTVVWHMIKNDKEFAKEYFHEYIKGKFKRPNNLEQKLIDLLVMLKAPFEYNNGKIIIDTKIPDFVSIDGSKRLIEVFGTHWHNPTEEQERKKMFAQHGFKCLVLWENEFYKGSWKKDISTRITNFN